MPDDSRAAGRTASRGPDDGTPEQIHLTWGDDPARSVVVSWASPGRAARPRVRIGQRVIPAEERGYTDGLNGQAVWTYHARVHGLRPGATYGYAVTADNDGNGADPFSAMFSTAPEGRAAFRFTSFGDLATPNTDWVLSYGQAAYAVGAVEQFQPLFHLLNGDLCYADLNPAAQPHVWRDFLVLCGHDHDYERSFPVRGFDPAAGTSVATGAPVDTRRPHPVTTVDSGVFDTSQGTVHLVLGCGGTDANLDVFGTPAAGRPDEAKVFTTPNRPVLSATPGVYDRPGADAVEDATWLARRDTATGYGIAVFDVNPGTEAGGQTSITVTHYHALGADPVNPSSGEPGAPTGDYTVFETFTLVRPRSDGRRWHAKQSASAISGLADLPAALPARGHVRAKRRVHSGTKTRIDRARAGGRMSREVASAR